MDTETQAYTVRLELVDEPGELLRALGPISEQGGNLLSVFHERGNLTPRGYIPVEIDLEATPEQYERIVEGFHNEEITVIQSGAERFSDAATVVLSGNVIDTDLSDTVREISSTDRARVVDLALSAPQGTQRESSARMELAIEAGAFEATLNRVRAVADRKNLAVIEPLSSAAE